MKKTDPIRLHDYLLHIVEAIESIFKYLEDNDIDEAKFSKNKLIQDAVVRNIEVIGKAAKNVMDHHPSFADQHSEVDWRKIYGMRNHLSHGYFKIDYEIVWNVIQRNLPDLHEKIKALLTNSFIK
jgi:uncharacterized protein with HEPN domain